MREVIGYAGQDDCPGDLEDLMVRCGRADQSALVAIYDASVDRVYGVALRVLRDPGYAQDVTQETFMEVWRCASRFDPSRGSALSWVSTIAHRKAVDRVRSAAAAPRREATYYRLNHTVGHDATSDLAMRNEEARRVRVALDRLTSPQRQAIELAYFGALTHREVATSLRIPLGTAKSRIRDGLVRLRMEWAEVA